MKAPHTLLATTGASPQVVTETLYALHYDNGQWPDEIFLITTSFGKSKAVAGLIEEGHLQRLCTQLQRPQPAFSAEHILVVPGADGAPVDDARSLADHEALANFIMTEVRNRTIKSEGSLHASLAGGRKTMTFYIGYAMSLFGRVQDSLSHVLVSEGYESVADFWFPTSDPAHRHIRTHQGQALDASAAQVTLAPIPFVRHRRDLPKVLLQTSETVDFARLVRLINLGEQPDNLRLTIDVPSCCIRLEDSDGALQLEFTPGLNELAFYAMIARATLAGENDLTRPGERRGDKGLTRSFVNELLALCRLQPRGSLEADLDALADSAQLRTATIDSLRNGMVGTWFDSRRNQLGALFAEKLPGSLARWLLPTIIWTEDGLPVEIDSDRRTPKGGGYGIPLDANQINFVTIA
jgi:CRISPR-associated protein (TIGR02584 family)